MTPFRISGVIEGFYGTPWSPEQRLRLIELLGKWGLNTFMVGPKDDPWHRMNWKAPFGADLMAHVDDLVEQGRRNNVAIAVAMSPGLTIRYSNPDDIQALVAKAHDLMAHGVSHIALLVDDIPDTLQHPQDQSQFESIAQAHVHLVNEFAKTLLGKVEVTVCPLVYHGLGTEQYVHDLGQGISPDINFMWTGRQICSRYLHSSDAKVLKQISNHRPLFWDNYPVNDVAMTYELHIGPLQGRDADLGDFAEGLLSNPMSAFESSLIPLRTIALYLNDPGNYDPDTAWAQAVTETFSDLESRRAFSEFGRTVLDSCLTGDAAPDVQRTLNSAAFAWRSGEVSKAINDLSELAQSIKMNSELLLSESFELRQLQSEISPWVTKYQLGGNVINTMAQSLTHYSSSDSQLLGQIVSVLRDSYNELHNNRYRVFGDGLEMLLTELIAEFTWSLDHAHSK